jgi:hypothetical protein
MTSPYEPPRARDARPLAIQAFRAYAALLFVMYVALAVVFGFVSPSESLFVPAGCAALAVLYAAAFVAPIRPWAWTLALVAIGIGLTGFTIVFAIPLLVVWIRPTTKAAYGRLP